MIKTVIIDDEQEARGLLRRLIKKSRFPIEVIGEADDVITGVAALESLQPDLVFLDINLKTGTGFDLLKQVPDLTSEVIFVTAYDQYALKAFEYAAVGYLLKPLSVSQLTRTVERVVKHRSPGRNQRLSVVLENKDREKLEQIVVPDMNGFKVLKLPQIVYLKGEVNYTRFMLADGTELLSSRTLKDYERLLRGNGYCRIHQSYLINLLHVKGYQRGEGGVVLLNDGTHLDVSRRRKRAFMENFAG